MCFSILRILVFLGTITEMAEPEEIFGLVFEHWREIDSQKFHSDVHSIKVAYDVAYWSYASLFVLYNT